MKNKETAAMIRDNWFMHCINGWLETEQFGSVSAQEHSKNIASITIMEAAYGYQTGNFSQAAGDGAI